MRLKVWRSLSIRPYPLVPPQTRYPGKWLLRISTRPTLCSDACAFTQKVGQSCGHVRSRLGCSASMTLLPGSASGRWRLAEGLGSG